MTPKRLTEIREWYDRHQHDYDARNLMSPPKVWTEYFHDLLSEVIALYERKDVNARAAGEDR